jgi:hypothetical protein
MQINKILGLLGLIGFALVGIVVNFGILYWALNLQVPIIEYNALTGKYLNDSIKYYGSSGSTFYGTATIFDMIFNRECPEIFNPRTFNYDSQTLNTPYAHTIIDCNGDFRWGDKFHNKILKTNARMVTPNDKDNQIANT